jgi:alpha-mannosidase
LLKAWKIVLCQQFHDILPGSAIREVYEDSHVEYEKACQLLAEVRGEIDKALYVDKPGTYTVWNNSNWRRTSVVRILNTSDSDCFRDEAGQLLDHVTKEGVTLVLVKDMAPFSFVTLYRGAASLEADYIDRAAKQHYTQAGTCQAETGFYRIAWNQWGQLTEIYDKEAHRDILAKGKRGNVLQVFEDKPRCFDAWELEPTYGNKMEEIKDLKEVRTEINPLGIWITFLWNYHKSTISQTLCLYHEKKRIDFKTQIIWEERQKLVKAAFPVEIRSIDARFDIQYGNIRRRITRNDSWEAARFEVIAHKWVDFSETGYGVALLNDCKYGHDIYENTIRLTLLKSATDPDYAADLGLHEFTYSIYPHSEEWYDSGLEQEAFDLNNLVTAVCGTPKITAGSPFGFDSDYISVDCIKQAEHSEDTVLRFHEFAGSRVSTTLKSALNISSWCQCDLMERPSESFKSEPVKLEFLPYEIKTILVRFNREP